KRLDTLSEDPLCESLAKHAKEVDLGSVKGTREKLLAKAREVRADKKSPSPILALCAARTDLKGLPMIGEEDCQVGPEAVKKMQPISDQLRKSFVGFGRSLGASDHYRARELARLLEKQSDWLKPDGLSTLVQMIQAEDPLSRRELVKRLATVPSAGSSTF